MERISAEQEKRMTANDGELVERARAGDQDAFGELVRRHRTRIFGMADRLMRDHQLAEDVVQEAFLQAFLHLGKLMRPDRFAPWLSRIARNETLMKLRRGGPNYRECTFTSLQGQGGNGLDNVLHALRKSLAADDSGQTTQDPAERLLRKETIETIHGFLQCLNRREREVFEAYFFRQLSPAEIAAMLDTTKSYVYKTISLSRHKVQREQMRGYIGSRLKSGREQGASRAVTLAKPHLLHEPQQSWHSVHFCLHLALQYTANNRYSLSDIIGFTGHAHRTTIERFSVDVSGPGFYDWGAIFARGMRNMGVRIRVIERPQFNPPVPELVADAVELIRFSIDNGVPALVWNLMNGEFALVYGYDDERQQFAAVDTKQEGSVSYDSLGQGKFAELFVMVLTECFPVEEKDAVMQALEMITEHAAGKEKGYPEFVYGIEAYAVWIELFRGGKVDPLGNAYSLHCVRESREHAAAFARQLAIRAEWGTRFCEAADKAATVYDEIVEATGKLCVLFPFPSGGNPDGEEEAETAIVFLERVMRLEEKGARMLQHMLETLNYEHGMIL